MTEPTVEIIEHDDLMKTALATGAGKGMVAEGTQLISERSLFGDVITAQPTKVPRDEAKILRRIDVMAAAAGEAWFYRFPVKDKGRTKYIEGISIDGADAVSRYYGNCRIDCAVVDTGPARIIYGRFIDLETGYTLIRPFLQSKQGSRLGGEDDDRRLSIALGIGTSKSQRNVIDHALRDFTTRAFEQAKKNLVERVGQKLPEYRKRCIDRIVEYGDAMLGRVERAYGRAAAEWLATDVARIITELRDIASGMTTVDEAWPLAAPEPRRTDDVGSAAPPQPEAAEQPEGTVATREHASTETGGAADGAGASHPSSAARPEGHQVDADARQGLADGEPQPQQPPPRVWKIGGDIVGQEAFLKAMRELLSLTASEADLDELLKQNAERLAKLTGLPMQQWRHDVKTRRDELKAAPR